MADWSDGDAAALRAALSTMEDWDGSLAALCGFDSDYSSGSDVGRPMKPKARKTAAPYTAKQRKQEIAALRAEVEKLQDVVDMEQMLGEDVPQTTEATMEEAAVELEWERLAATQKQERFEAQLKNAKLRNLLQSERRNTEKILKLTKRVKHLEDALPMQEAPSFDNYRMPHIDASAQLQRLDSLIPRAAEIFSSGAFAAAGPQCFREMHFRERTPAVVGVDFDVDAAWVLPFPIDRVADALWFQTTRPTFRHKTVAFLDVYEDASSLASQFISTTAAGENWGASQGQMAAKRFPPSTIDGSILIGVTTNASVYAGSKWLTSTFLVGWLQVKSMAGTGKSSQPLTQIKWHRHVTLQPPDDAEMTSEELGKWTQRIIRRPSRSRVETELEWSVQAIDNLLLTPKEEAR